jgi:hypothetical protein
MGDEPILACFQVSHEKRHIDIVLGKDLRLDLLGPVFQATIAIGRSPQPTKRIRARGGNSARYSFRKIRGIDTNPIGSGRNAKSKDLTPLFQ